MYRFETGDVIRPKISWIHAVLLVVDVTYEHYQFAFIDSVVAANIGEVHDVGKGYLETNYKILCSK